MTEGTSSGISAGFALFLIFLVLKLVHVINWSWWWVTAPLWGGLVLTLLILGGVFLGLIISSAIQKRRRLR